MVPAQLFDQRVDDSLHGVLISAIQTSVAINRGNSGGALANLSSQVIGIPTLTATSPGAPRHHRPRPTARPRTGRRDLLWRRTTGSPVSRSTGSSNDSAPSG